MRWQSRRMRQSRKGSWLSAAAKVRSLLRVILLALPSLAAATEVSVVAIAPGRSATLIIDSKSPMLLEIGEAVDGVRLLRAERTQAVLDIDGSTKTLPLLSGSSANRPGSSTGSSIVLSADESGHFTGNALVNGRTLRVLVDTGATVVAISRRDAERLGISYRHGKQTISQTASGLSRGWEISLDSVSLGSVTVRNVEAVVMDSNALPFGLLGMSFLNRFNLQRQGATLILRRRN